MVNAVFSLRLCVQHPPAKASRKCAKGKKVSGKVSRHHKLHRQAAHRRRCSARLMLVIYLQGFGWMADRVEATKHIADFVQAFVDRTFRHRWMHGLLEKPSKAKETLVKFGRHLDQRRCRLLEGPELHLEALEVMCGPRKGLYFDGLDEPCFVTAEEASTRANNACSDAIFSIVLGRKAIFFFHEGWAWLCERGN